MSVKSAIGEYGNQFLETSSDILVLGRRDIVEKSGVYSVYRMESQGCQQYYNLSERFLESWRRTIYTTSTQVPEDHI